MRPATLGPRFLEYVHDAWFWESEGTPISDSESRAQAPVEPMGLASASLAILTSLLWGGTAVAISFSVDTLPPVAVAGFRFSMAVLVMLVWCRFEGSGLAVERTLWKYPFIAGAMLFLQISLFNVGVLWSNSSHGALLINLGVFGVVAIEHYVTKTDRLTVQKSVGLILAGTGVVVMLAATGEGGSPGQRDQPTISGDLVLLASAFVLAIKIVYTKHAVAHVPPGKLIFWHNVVGVTFFFGWSSLTETIRFDGFTLPAVLGLLYQGVCVAGLCFAIQAHLLKKHSASQIAVFSFAMPLFGILFGNLLRNDPLSGWILVAGLGVATGILLVNRPEKIPEPPATTT